MASGRDRKEDDDYDSALRRLMNDCLPPILVDIADKRPQDPIQYMAQCLYQYREKEDAELFAGLQPFSDPEGAAGNNSTQHHTTHTSSRKQTMYPKTQQLTATSDRLRLVNIIHASDDESVNETYDIKRYLGDQAVHRSCITVLETIDDIFDDSDIT